MLPPLAVGPLLIVLALVPGWFYLRLVERLRPPATYSGLHQLLEVLLVGVGTSGVAAFAVLLAPHRYLTWTVEIEAWATGGDQYLRDHPRAAAYSLALVFGLALAIAYLLYLFRRLRLPREYLASGNVWVHSIGARPRGTHPYLGVHLKDGRLVEGPAHSFALDDEDGGRDLALARPIQITAEAEGIAQPLPNLDRLVIPAESISFIGVIHGPAARKRQRRFRRRA